MPPSELMALQEKFCLLAAKLILQANVMGYGTRFGEALRTPEQAAANALSGAGISNSLHIQRLALDLLLDKNGQWLKNTEDYRPLGEWWKKQDPLCRWGGDFKSRPDGNHFSLAYQGRA